MPDLLGGGVDAHLDERRVMPVSLQTTCRATVLTPWPISVQPWSMTTLSGASTVMRAEEASGMPLPMPVFLRPQAMPGVFGGVELVFDGQQRLAHAGARLDDLARWPSCQPSTQGVVVAELPAVKAALLAQLVDEAFQPEGAWLTPKPRMAPQGILLV
jgi:hypothetical protein